MFSEDFLLFTVAKDDDDPLCALKAAVRAMRRKYTVDKDGG